MSRLQIEIENFRQKLICLLLNVSAAVLEETYGKEEMLPNKTMGKK
jgi:hypothetical protein